MKKILILLLLISSVNHSFSQRNKTKTSLISYPESIYNSVKWRLVGPFRGGRAGTVSGVIDDNNLYYMGTAGGGVWKTEDAGNSWECISDGYFGGSIGSVSVSESDPNIIYVGEGEQTLRGNVSSGKGAWKSTDAGKSWSFIGLNDTEHISRIRIHPKNPDIVYFAALGNLWKPNKERGLYKSIDGGKSWKKILYVSDKAGVGDIILDPNNPRIIYASTWQMKRNGYRMDSGGPDSKVFRSNDGGENWIDISNHKGLPEFPWGIVGITISPVNSNRIWIMIEADNGGLFRSDDAGETWEKVNSNRALRQRAWYYTRIYADTQNEDKIYVLNVSYGVSTDGGKTFKLKNAPHGDHHDLWIDPNNNNRMVVADDGGAQVSNDGGENWTTYFNQPTAQFYRVTTDNTFPYKIYGAQQDNSTIRISHRTSGGSISERDWESTAGGESAHLAPDPNNNDIVYGGTYKGYMMRRDHSINQTRSVNVWPDNPAGSGVEVMKYRFNWNFPVIFSPHDSKKLYAGSNFLHQTTNEGQSWEVISPDLTRGIPKTMKSSGGLITQDNTGAEFYANIFVIQESMREKGVIWVGSDDGLIHISKDNGSSWVNVTPPESISPKLNMINSIDVSPFTDGTAYVAATSYKFGDYTPYLYKTSNYGENWELITNGINSNYYTRVIRSDKVVEGLLYAGTEWGMFISFDDGKSWSSFQLNLPITSIRDLQVKENDLIAATHGRSFWMIDDLTPLHQLNQEMINKNSYLFKPDKSYRMHQSGGWGRVNTKLVGENHPNGVIINYYIKNLKENDKVRIDILDSENKIIQSYSNKNLDDIENNDSKPVLSNSQDIDYALTGMNIKSLKVKSGGNRLIWDMRYPGFTSFDGMVLYSSPNVGPKAIPGNYKVKMYYNDDIINQDFTIVKDPRISNTLDDYEEQFNFLIDVRNQVSRANQAIIDIREGRENLNFIKKQVNENDQLIDLINEFDKKISVIENNIHMTKNKSRQDPLNYGIRINNRLAFLMADSQRGDYPPTDQSQDFFKEIKKELDNELINLNKILLEYTETINRQIEENNINRLKF
tara:strand:+ start:3630 stop:6815 length:3186 start_codon:yes stop_codon:yes gene_type:complete